MMIRLMHALDNFVGVACCLIVLGAACPLVYWLIRDLVRCLFEPAKPCTHPRLHSTKWLADDGTPMMHSWCPDCGWHDTGHVHADPTTWLEKKKKP